MRFANKIKSLFLYPNNLKNWFLTASACLQNFCLRSCLASRQWSFAPDKNFATPPCQIPHFSSCLGILLLLGIYAPIMGQTLSEYAMAIVIPSYNNEKWYEKNLQTVLNQQYSNYRILYVNDCSTDDTGNLVEQYLK